MLMPRAVAVSTEVRVLRMAPQIANARTSCNVAIACMVSRAAVASTPKCDPSYKYWLCRFQNALTLSAHRLLAMLCTASMV